MLWLLHTYDNRISWCFIALLVMQSLIEYFGNKNKIWSKCKNEFLNHFSGNPRKIWGLYGENKRVMAISKVMEFLRQAIELAETFKELKNEIYHSSTLETVVQVLPLEYYKQLNELTTNDDEPKENIESALNLLDVKKDSALKAKTFENQGGSVQRMAAFGDYDVYGRNYFGNSEGTYEGRGGEYRGRGRDYRSRGSNYEGRNGDYRDRDGYYRGRDGDYRGRGGSFKSRGRGFRDNQDQYERGYQDGLLKLRQEVYSKLKKLSKCVSYTENV